MILPRHISLFGRFIDLANIDCGAFAFDLHMWLHRLEFLWGSIAILTGMAFRLSPGRCCCGYSCADCTTNGTIGDIQVVISGVANSFCFDCLKVNATYILSSRDSLSPDCNGSCIWAVTMGEATDGCGGTAGTRTVIGCNSGNDIVSPYIYFIITSSGSDLTVSVSYIAQYNGGFADVTWQKHLASWDGDCSDIYDTYAVLQQGGCAAGGSSTAVVSAA